MRFAISTGRGARHAPVLPRQPGYGAATVITRITLVGFRAAGKSTVGRQLARLLGWSFLDADAALAEELGQPIATFLTQAGEPAFRAREATCLARLLAEEAPQVLATGGGVVLREDNRQRLRTRGGLVVYLCAPVAVLQGRLRAHHGDRPSLTGAGLVAEVAPLLAVRDPLYREVASQIVDATAPVETVVEHLAQAVRARA